MSEVISDRVKAALEMHDRGFNCAQAVSCAFLDKTGLDQTTLFRVTEGMGSGMGCMEGTCGAIAAAAVLSGLKNSTAHFDHPDSKAASYKGSRACLNKFKELHGTVICKDIKGVGTGTPIRSCRDCVADAVKIIEKELYREE